MLLAAVLVSEFLNDSIPIPNSFNVFLAGQYYLICGIRWTSAQYHRMGLKYFLAFGIP
jgi:hypothetical protein